MNYSSEELERRYAALPDDVKNAISSEEVAMQLSAIGEKHGLLEDRVEVLVSETGYVMLGMTHPSAFIQNLTTRMGISRDSAQAIAEEVNQTIFKPVRESLKKIHGMSGTATPAASPAPTQTLKKEDVLREIEDPAKAPTENPVVMEHAEILQKVTVHPVEGMDIRPAGRTENGGSYRTDDPYREPV